MKFILPLLLVPCFWACGDHNRSSKSSPEPIQEGTLSLAGLARVSLSCDGPLLSGGDNTNDCLVGFTNPAGQSVAEVELDEFHPMMPAMGHGTDESTQEIQRMDNQGHVFQVSGIYFNMPGSAGGWVAKVHFRLGDQTDEVTVSFEKVE